MINVGFYYRVKKGKTDEFEKIFTQVTKKLMEGNTGIIGARLYKSVEEPNEYLIYTEWNSVDDFKKFMMSEDFRQTTAIGKEIIEGRPTHKVFKEFTEA
ncbi:antibiotic biosynthesis monooxygenase [Sulfolobales archaeon HS-7]|nr:antibiotic biosynthesis monooxygenase [Sulfolobales archaeon HS-7]